MANESEQQSAPALQPPFTTAAAAADARPLATLDPRLFMAARRGDSEALKQDLLQFNDDDGNDDQQDQDTWPDDEGSGTPTPAAAASVAAAPSIPQPHLHVIVEVNPRRHDAVSAPLPPPPVPVLDEDEATIEGESLWVHSETVEQVVEPPPHDDDAAALPARQPRAAAPAGPSAVPVVLYEEYGVTMEGDSLLHVVAASGDTRNYLDCAEMIYDKASRLLVATNTKGDSPLHCAASAGNANMISRLIFLAARDVETSVEALVRMRNECGETALHHAVRAAKNNEACIDRLMAVDSDLACIPNDKEEGSSPLYLAISMGEVQIARHLYDKSEGKLSYSGPDGRNVLHAAVSRGQEEALRMVLRMVLGRLRASADKQQQGGQGHADHLRLLSQLTSQRDEENGSTPLHLAASLAGLPSPCMYKTHPHVWGWSGSPARLLLFANESMAYQPDKGGLYPIHVAAGAGSLGVVSALLWTCPDCATLRDAKGRTFLHIAVEEGRYPVVRYVCDQRQRKPQNPSARLLASILNSVVRYVCCQRQMKQNPAAAGLLSSILNAQDINGDTPLHRAVHAGYRAIFFRLVRNPRVRLDVQNNKGMRPIDVAWSKMPLSVYYAWDSRIRIRRYLIRVGAPYGEISRGDRFDQKHILSKQDEEKMSADLTAAAQVLCLFSVLITTVTFSSAFTLPGGYRSAGDAAAAGGVAGTPVLAGRSYAFDAFVLSDTLAFMCSLHATSLLLYAGVPRGTLTSRFRLINGAYALMWHAGRSLVAAFSLGLYIVLLPVTRTIAIAVLVLMVIIAIRLLKPSEGIISSMCEIGSLPIPAPCEAVLQWVIYVLDHFWSYMIIFGLPAIRKWARLH